jgi:hypothetical protein
MRERHPPIAVLTIEEAQADLARVASQVREDEARAVEAERLRILRELGTNVRGLDDLIARIRASDLPSHPGGAQVLADAQALRATLYGHIQALAPEEAWFWTEEWQAGEREADAQIAAGQLITFESDEEFDAYLRRLRPDVADL